MGFKGLGLEPSRVWSFGLWVVGLSSCRVLVSVASSMLEVLRGEKDSGGIIATYQSGIIALLQLSYCRDEHFHVRFDQYQ